MVNKNSSGFAVW